RTFDIQLPKLARYQTALHPEKHAEFTFILFRMQVPFLKKCIFRRSTVSHEFLETARLGAESVATQEVTEILKQS
ncbi:MAG: hypothetical protein JXX29_06615, partial [Deltaproteobacteria bacterium]|nr:hypothetical protein [Deltaproteobacteria bacterium]